MALLKTAKNENVRGMQLISAISISPSRTAYEESENKLIKDTRKLRVNSKMAALAVNLLSEYIILLPLWDPMRSNGRD